MNTNKTNAPWPAHRVQFITLCTHEKQTTLGRIYKDKNGFVWQPTVWGMAAEEGLRKLKLSSQLVLIQDYVIMPNHVHLLVLYRRCNDRVVKWFISHCKHTMAQHMLKAQHTNEPIWETSYSSHYVQREHTQLALSQNIREHKTRWHYDSLNTFLPRPYSPKV